MVAYKLAGMLMKYYNWVDDKCRILLAFDWNMRKIINVRIVAVFDIVLLSR